MSYKLNRCLLMTAFLLLLAGCAEETGSGRASYRRTSRFDSGSRVYYGDSIDDPYAPSFIKPKPVSPEVPEKPQTLSYGTITSRVKKGVTTQADLLELFGGPNITTLDSDGTETWVYEATASHSETDVENLEVFFELDFYPEPVRGYVKGPTAHSAATRTVKTLTVIIKFNPDKTVKEYSARAAYF